MSMTASRGWVACLLGAIALAGVACAGPGSAVREDGSIRASARQAQQWQDELANEDALVRRGAVRRLAASGEIGREGLLAALSNQDAQVRRVAVTGLARLGDASAAIALGDALGDEDWLVRQAAVQGLAGLSPRSSQVEALLEQASNDEDLRVRRLAIEALWPYSAPPRAVRDRPNVDYDLRTTQTIKLPATGWKFHVDRDQKGHLRKWYEAAFDDSGWQDFEIEKHWGDQGHPGYSGVGWYRLTLDLPDRPRDSVGVDLVFEAVDNSAWVWVNGQFLAAHDIGPSGWDKTFRIDVTDHLKWGQPNQVTVRVRNGPYAGGIYKPIRLDVYER